ncbi:hypothetical protein WDW89_18640 [Deltaproteobacteria bacterium TL4]
MIEIIKPYFVHSDVRGSIQGLVNFGKWEEINYITSIKGTVRGGHFHTRTRELFVILEGKIEVTVQHIINNALHGKIEKLIVEKNQVVLVEPFTNHIFCCLEDSSWINILSTKMDPDSPDFFRPE